MKRQWSFACAFCLSASIAGAGQAVSNPQAGQQPPPKTDLQEQEKKPEEVPRYEEQVVVTASKTEQQLINAPATVTLISSQTIQSSPAVNYADLLRAVPGLNVSQTSARDINVTSRGATGTLSTSQLALVDGRSIYQDFFGFIMWDALPINMNEIKQIEVIRGPASAVWGANALNGVINVITKSPREMQGSSFTLGLGSFNRDVGEVNRSAGSLFYLNGSYAQAVDDRWAYKVSAGGYTQDPFARPVGTINNSFHTPYPAFENKGTTLPKFDGRLDYDFEDGKQKLIVAGGVAGTKGLIHTGIGPFDINSGSLVSYTKANYSRNALKLNFFVNLLNGDATNLLARGPTGQLLPFDFKTQTYDAEFGNVNAIGTKQVVSYGGNVRHSAFDLSIAPRGSTRNEGGGYVQDEIFISEYLRLVLGGRLDKFDVIDHAVFSPRTTLLIKPGRAHTFRVSYNRGYRAPSLVNNFLETVILNQLDLGLFDPRLRGRAYAFPVAAIGNEHLKERRLTAYEVGYSGVIANRATVTAAFYVNDSRDDIFFTQIGSYTGAHPPPGWPLPPAALDLLIASGRLGPGLGLPSLFSYENFGKVRDKGFELGVDTAVGSGVNLFANYSYEAKPIPTGFDISELNLPPKNRFNAGVNFNMRRYLGNLSVNYVDSAFWQDVLDSTYHGATDPYTMINAGFGVRWAGDRLTTSVKVINLANEEVLQHVFGDVIKRQVVGELRVNF
jgi:iron complex outermembrane receptor protein